MVREAAYHCTTTGYASVGTVRGWSYASWYGSWYSGGTPMTREELKALCDKKFSQLQFGTAVGTPVVHPRKNGAKYGSWGVPTVPSVGTPFGTPETGARILSFPQGRLLK